MRTIVAGLLLFLSSGTFGQYERRMVAEWEPAFGTLIRWPLGIPSELVVELAEDDSLFILVETTTQQLQAQVQFQSWGVNMGHCRFLLINTYSHWTRDWGPHYVFDEQGKAAIADPEFNGYPWVPGCNYDGGGKDFTQSKGFEEDDVVNIALAGELGLPLIDLPCYLTGGNIMTDGHGYAVSTRQMLDENLPICNEECFMNATADSMGLFKYMITENPEVFGIQHMDCYAKFLDEETVLVKELDPGHPEYQCAEDLAGFYAGRKSCYGNYYNVVRIYCPPYAGNEVAAYTNSLILNKKVLVPLFGIEADQQAIETYRDAMPGYEVVGIYFEDWYYYDALHCRTMAIFDHEMLRIWHKPLKKVAAYSPVEIIALIDDRSESGLIPGQPKLYYRIEGEFYWNVATMNPAYGLDTFNTFLPAFEDSTVVQYYITAADSSGRIEKLPRTAPGGFCSFQTINWFVDIPELVNLPELTVTGGHGMVTVKVETSNREQYHMHLINLQGSTIREIKGLQGNFLYSFNLPGGLYIVNLQSNGHKFSKKVVVY